MQFTQPLFLHEIFRNQAPLMHFRLTAIFDSCHSQTALDLPFIYDCYGNIKKQKVSMKIFTYKSN